MSSPCPWTSENFDKVSLMLMFRQSPECMRSTRRWKSRPRHPGGRVVGQRRRGITAEVVRTSFTGRGEESVRQPALAGTPTLSSRSRPSPGWEDVVEVVGLGGGMVDRRVSIARSRNAFPSGSDRSARRRTQGFAVMPPGATVTISPEVRSLRAPSCLARRRHRHQLAEVRHLEEQSVDERMQRSSSAHRRHRMMSYVARL